MYYFRKGIFYSEQEVVFNSLGNEDIGHLQPNERAEKSCARGASRKTEDGTWARPLRERHPPPRLPFTHSDDDPVNNVQRSAGRHGAFENSFYVNEEASCEASWN